MHGQIHRNAKMHEIEHFTKAVKREILSKLLQRDAVNTEHYQPTHMWGRKFVEKNFKKVSVKFSESCKYFSGETISNLKILMTQFKFTHPISGKEYEQ